ncbi:MAG: hypothetical protein J6I49_00640 [Bacteroidales bacterium]|nr:hypothetical protein [Bacteroidales bacterium]
MKKVLSFFGAALFVAAMTVSCGNNKPAEAEEVVDEAIETVAEEAAATVSTATVDMDRQAMLAAAAEAGRAKCNCYKKDASSVEACIKSILSQSYAAYEGNDEFKAAMEAEFNSCVKEKVADAAKEAGDKAVKSAASAIANKLGGK